MDQITIKCIFCGGIANIREEDDLKIISCPKCKRETASDAYNDLFDIWMGDIRDKAE
jgi:hypothetical protein